MSESKAHKTLWLLAFLLMLIVLSRLWIGFNKIESESVDRLKISRVIDNHEPEVRAGRDRQKVDADQITNDGADVKDGNRKPLQFQAKPVEATAVIEVLASSEQSVDERVRRLQEMRGISLSEDERKAAFHFLAGREIPEGMSKGSMHWLADELLSVLRLQEPAWNGLAAELADVAFQPTTDPVVRDYIMQHLGHFWEQYGSRGEIDDALWRAVSTNDETTPGTALIALSRGYERDQQKVGLAKIRQQALIMAQSANTPLTVRVTALSIAGDSGGEDVKQLASGLLKNPETPIILRKVAEQASK